MKHLKRYGFLLILSGPSGSGKSTLSKKLLETFDSVGFSVSCTTRAPRGQERDGVEYYFRTKEEFEELIRKNAFLEYANVHGNYYGTLKEEVFKRLEEGMDVLLDIDVQGALSIKKLCREDENLARSTETVFVAPPSYKALEQRLRGRGTDTEEVIARRLENAIHEMEFWQEYDYTVLNDTLPEAEEEICSIFRSLRLKSKRFREDPFHDN